MLPEIKNINVERNNFPTKWQTVIFRNYRMAPDKNIAKILGCTVSDVACEAARMGLRTGDTDPAWLERGYITPKEQAELKRLWNVYHKKLKGNGEAEAIYNLVEKLPVRLHDESK